MVNQENASVGEQISQDDCKSVSGPVQRGVQPWTGGGHQGGGITIEVETPETVADAGRQLSGHRGPVYVAGTNKKAVEQALDLYGDSTIGVMDNQGKIVKRSTR